MTNAHLDPSVKHDIVMLFDATDSNPNGDPDAGNRPRADEETNVGIVTDVAIKRKIRDTIGLAATDLGLAQDRFNLFVTADKILDDQITAAVPDFRADSDTKKLDPAAIDSAHRALLERYIDVRLFGAVLTGGNGRYGHIRGPLQVGFSRSIDPVHPVEHTITRVTASSRARAEEKNVRTEMGGKWTVSYGLYRASLHYSGALAERVRVSEDDLRVLYHAIPNMFEHTRSAARPDMNVRGLYVFSHATSFGNAPVHLLENLIQVETKPDVEHPRSFDDYTVNVQEQEIPDKIALTRVLG